MENIWQVSSNMHTLSQPFCSNIHFYKWKPWEDRVGRWKPYCSVVGVSCIKYDNPAAITCVTIQHEKEQIKKIEKGKEFGTHIKGFNDIKEGDIIQTFEDVLISN